MLHYQGFRTQNVVIHRGIASLNSAVKLLSFCFSFLASKWTHSCTNIMADCYAITGVQHPHGLANIQMQKKLCFRECGTYFTAYLNDFLLCPQTAVFKIEQSIYNIVI